MGKKLFIYTLVFLISGCVPAAKFPSLNSPSTKLKTSPTPGLIPTPTLTPSLTPTPTPTLTPTSTPSATLPPVTSNFEVGVNVHLATNFNDYNLMKVMGAKWVRIDLNWNIVEPQPGVWNYSAVDSTVNVARQNGFQIYAVLAYAPSWRSSNGQINGVPNSSAWQEFVQRVVQRYKDQISVFGIWNEPNLSGFWIGSAQQYVDVLLKPAYNMIKSIKPSLLVAGPDLAHLYNATINCLTFFNTLKSSGGDAYLDIISHHIYGGDDFDDKVLGFYYGGTLYKDGLRQWLDKSGILGKPVWVTEIGVDANQTGEQLQSSYLRTQVQFLSRTPWIQRAFIYEIKDDPSIEWQYGLINRNGQLRPVYNTLKALILNGYQ